MPLLKSVMTPFPYSVDLDAPIDEARRLMAEHDVHHLPVMHDGEIVGVLTGRSLARPPAAPGAGSRVRDRCVPDPYVIDLNAPLAGVLAEMAGRRLGSAIVTREGRLCGVFTWVDALRAFAGELDERFSPPEGDDAA